MIAELIVGVLRFIVAVSVLLFFVLQEWAVLSLQVADVQPLEQRAAFFAAGLVGLRGLVAAEGTLRLQGKSATLVSEGKRALLSWRTGLQVAFPTQDERFGFTKESEGVRRLSGVCDLDQIARLGLRGCIG